jgi:hypothetical protein
VAKRIKPLSSSVAQTQAFEALAGHSAFNETASPKKNQGSLQENQGGI